ncbi:MAG: hypothetical protein JST44_20435 [Cyanobacteria bacterium SZAS LIN-5]|nr:hypothetical protein [Cyanobacteria bacterium SZAS LIN-5]
MNTLARFSIHTIMIGWIVFPANLGYAEFGVMLFVLALPEFFASLDFWVGRAGTGLIQIG